MCTFTFTRQFHAPCRQPRRKLGEHAVWRALPHAEACAWGALVWGVLWLHRRGLARGGDEEVRSGREGPVGGEAAAKGVTERRAFHSMC